MKVILTGGGTGGSVTPLLAVANKIKEKQTKTEFLWIGTKHGPAGELVKANNIQFKAIFSGKLRRYFDWQNFTDPFLILIGFVQSLIIISRFKPAVIVSAGSFVSVPVIWAGWILRVPGLIHQMDLRPGLANKLMARFASRVTVTFEESVSDFQVSQAVWTGNPIRPEIFAGSKDGARKIFNLEHYLPTVLVIGGGTGALRINEIIAQALPGLVKFCQIIHITGKDRRVTKAEPARYHCYEFLTADLKDALAAADLVVSRCGIGALTELSALNKPAILIPMPDSHQELNGQYFEEKKAGIVLDQKQLTPEHLVGYIKYLLTNRGVLNKLGQNIGKITKQNGAESIAREVLKLGNRGLGIGDSLKIKTVHFVGIGGIGISAIAKKFLLEKKKVSGSDQADSFIIEDLKKMGANIKIGHDQDNLPDKTDLLIYSASVPDDNPERVKARQIGVQQLSYPRMLGRLTEQKNRSIAVSGNKGKTTVTALTGLILEAAGLDPEVVVGSYLKDWRGNYRPGQADYLVAEACEWQAHMLNMSPWSIILTNLEADHLDYYKNLDNIIKAFQEYINKLPKTGWLVINNDDENLKKLILPDCQIVTYGINNQSDLMAENIIVEHHLQKFNLFYKGNNLGRFKLRVPGKFNIYNALAAASLAFHLGIKPEIIRKVLADYHGCWRRFEILGDYQGTIVVSDYAHHPTAIRQTLQAAREFYSDKRLVLAFQPHHHHRTKSLFNEFVESFDQADLLILNEIYKVAGRDELNDSDISSRDLIRAVQNRDKTRQVSRNILFGRTIEETKKLILDNIKTGDLVIVMGAGDLYLKAEELFQSK